jgi:hypothetical protein
MWWFIWPFVLKMTFVSVCFQRCNYSVRNRCYARRNYGIRLRIYWAVVLMFVWCCVLTWEWHMNERSFSGHANLTWLEIFVPMMLLLFSKTISFEQLFLLFCCLLLFCNLRFTVARSFCLLYNSENISTRCRLAVANSVKLDCLCLSMQPI